MAGFNSDDRNNLKKISDNFGSQTIRVPGGDKSSEEIAYSTTDLILGIAAVGMFGTQFKSTKGSNINTVLGQKSFLSNINDYIEHVLVDPKAKNTSIRTSIVGMPIVKLEHDSTVDLISSSIEALKDAIKPNGNEAIAQIVLSIDNAASLSELNKSLEELAKITDDPAKITSSIQTVEDLFKVINELPNIDKSFNVDPQFVTNLEQFINAINKADIPKFDSTKSEAVKSFFEFINYLNVHGSIDLQLETINSIGDTLYKINSAGDLSNLNHVDDNIKQIFNVASILANDKFQEDLKRANTNLSNVIKNKQVPAFENVKIFLDAIDKLAGTLDNIDKSKGLGDLLNAILNLSHFDGNINIEALDKLSYVVEPQGIIHTIINNVKTLAKDSVNPEATKAIRNIQEFLNTIKSLSDIGARDKIRIISNMLFFKYYINKTLPALIQDIENSFKGIILNGRNATLDNLERYFNSLKEITIFSFKDKIKIVSSMLFMRKYLIEEMAKLIKDIQKSFKGIKIDDNISEVFDFFGKLSKMNISGDFEKQKESLEAIEDFLFGSKLAGRFPGMRTFDSIVGNSSILGIISRLQKETIDLGAAKKSIKNLRTILTDIKAGVSVFNISVNEMDDKSDALDLFNDGIIGFIINLSEKDKGKKINEGLAVLKSLTTFINTTYKNKTLGEILEKLDPNGADKYGAKLKKFLTGLLNLANYITKNQDELKNSLTVLSNFVKSINEQFKKESLDKSINKITIEPKTLDKLKSTQKSLEYIEKIGKLFTVIEKLKITDESLDNIKKISERLDVLISSLNKIDEKQLKQVNKIFESIFKFIIEATLILVGGTLLMTLIKWENLGKFAVGMILMASLIGGLLFAVHKLNIDEKKVDNITKIFKEIGKLILLSSMALFAGSMLASKVDIPSLAKYFGGLALMLALTGGLIFILNKSNINTKNIGELVSVAAKLSVIVFLLSAALSLVAIAATVTSPEQILAFGGMLILLIVAITIPLKVVSATFKMNMASAVLLGTLILMVSSALALGSWIVQNVPSQIIIKFGRILSLLIVSLSVPLLALSITGKAALQGGKDLGQLILYATIGLGIGALFMMIPGMKEKIQEFSGVYIGFLFKLLLAVGLCSLLSKHGLKDIQGVSKIIKTATFMLFIGGALFLFFPKLKDAVKEYSNTLLMFIGSIVLVVGLAALLGRKALKQMWQVSLLIVVATGCLLYAAHVLKDDPKANIHIWSFTAALLVLVGGLVFIAKIAKIGKLWKGLLSIGIITLMIFGIAYVFKYISDNLMQYDVGKLWAITGSMLGIIVMFLLGAALIGVIATLTLPAILAGAVAMIVVGLLMWGMAAVFKYIMSIDKEYGILVGDNDENRLEKIVNAMFDTIQVIIDRIRGLNLSGGAKTPLGKVFGALMGAGKTGALFLILDVIRNIALTMHFLSFATKDIDDPAALATKSGEMIDAIANIYNKAELIEKLKAIKDNKDLFKGLAESAKSLGEVIYNISLGIKSYAELKVAEIGPDGKPTGQYRDFKNEDFKNAAINIATIITCVGGAIMALFGIGPFAKDTTAGQQEIAKEMLETSRGLFGGAKTKFQLIMEGAQQIGNIIKNIADGAMEWTKLPNGFDSDKMANNIATIITAVGGAIMSLIKDGPTSTEVVVSDQEFKTTVVNELLQTASGGFLGLGSKKTKFQMVMEGAEKLGDIIKNIAAGVMEWSQIPPEIFSKEGANAAQDNIASIITTVGGAVMKLYTGEGLEGVTAETAKEMFGKGPWYNRSKNKFKQVVESVGKLGEMISNIMTGVQSYANLKIPTKYDNEGKPIEWKPMTNNDFMLAENNIGRIIMTLGDAVIKVGESQAFNSIFGGAKVKQISEAISNLAKVLSPIANTIHMYATGKFPILKYEAGKLVTAGTFDISKYKGGIDAVAANAKINIQKIITGLAEAIYSIYDNDKLKFLRKDQKEIITLSKSLLIITNTINEMFKSISKIVSNQLNSDDITTYIGIPFAEFINQTLYSNNTADAKYKLFTAHKGDDLTIYLEAIKKLVSEISTVFDTLKSIVEVAVEIKPNMQILYEVYDGYTQMYAKMAEFAGSYNEEIKIAFTEYNENLQSVIDIIKQIEDEDESRIDLLKEGISGLAAVIAGIKSNKNFSDHVKNIQSYVENTNKLDLIKIRSLTNLVNAINEFGRSFGNIDDFTNAIVEKLTESLDHLSKNLTEAKTTIETVEDLHDKRKTLIESSVRNIKELMDKELTVNIKEEQNENNPTLPSESPTGGESTPASGGSGGSFGGGGFEVSTPSPAPAKSSKGGASKNVTVELDADTIGTKIAEAILIYLKNKS